MSVTKDFLAAVIEGAECLRNAADNAEKLEPSKADNGAGRLIRLDIEQKRQQADLLEGWAKRNGWSEFRE